MVRARELPDSRTLAEASTLGKRAAKKKAAPRLTNSEGRLPNARRGKKEKNEPYVGALKTLTWTDIGLPGSTVSA